MAEKTKGEQLKEQLLMNPKNMGDTLDDETIQKAFDFCEDYKKFLTTCKTEREVVKYTIKLLEERGYTPYVPGAQYQPGDKIYKNNRGKALMMATIGSAPLSEGVHISASHIDNPRLDFKPRPLFEEGQLAYFKTHYYGGVKK